jgi:hypothetical protein
MLCNQLSDPKGNQKGPDMKISYGDQRLRQILWAGTSVTLAGLALWGIVPWGESASFGIKQGALTETNFSLTITNGTNTDFFEIHLYNVLGGQAIGVVTGYQGQTNFVLERGSELRRFFKASLNNDWDGDGIINVHDSDPLDTNYKALTITIESPAHGSSLP